jgi:hypothetical protein
MGSSPVSPTGKQQVSVADGLRHPRQLIQPVTFPDREKVLPPGSLCIALISHTVCRSGSGEGSV